MAQAADIVQGFQQALGKGDFISARKYLHDDLAFRGPIDAFDKPEPYLEALKKLHSMVQRVDVKKMFVDGNDVCMLYDLVTNTPAGTAFVSEWFQVKSDRITSIRVVFDGRPFAAMFERSGAAQLLRK
jgi:hypothetical protein